MVSRLSEKQQLPRHMGSNPIPDGFINYNMNNNKKIYRS